MFLQFNFYNKTYVNFIAKLSIYTKFIKNISNCENYEIENFTGEKIKDLKEITGKICSLKLDKITGLKIQNKEEIFN